MIATAGNGTVIEVFEWVEGGIEKVHSHPGLGQLWGRYAVHSISCVKALDESGMMFANFVPVN